MMKMMVRVPLLFAAAIAFALPAAAQAPSGMASALALGTVGERYDGYMGFPVPPSPEVRRQVNAVNLKRRNLYIQLSSGRNVTAELIGLTTACHLLTQLRTGQSYMLRDGIWRRLAPGERARSPDYCG